ncbi:MAG: hypothetical protein ACPGUV_07995 [Polyangiales bacterium]
MPEQVFSWKRRCEMKVEEAQVSATIAASTKVCLDRFSEEFGLRKNYIVEQALLYFIQSRRFLPDEAFTPTRIVLSDAAFVRLVDTLQDDVVATDALRELMRGADT